jgi:hypothetical protein
MNQGWNGDEYLILFTETEIAGVSERYGISKLLPGYEVVGLRGWDDFIVRDSVGRTYCIPTVPVDSQYLSSFAISESAATLHPDVHFDGKIKWYVNQ